MLPKGAVCLLLLALSMSAEALGPSEGPSRFYVKRDRPFVHHASRRSSTGEASSSLQARHDGFDPDVLNRFLEEYASKMKRTTERTTVAAGYDDDDAKLDGQRLDAGGQDTSARNATDGYRDETSTLNDTIKRHKFYSGNSHNEDNNRNSGWVTLDAIPWSKSKISKWQANPTTQGPWPDVKPWDKPSFNKPWNSDYPSRPASYESSKPWQNKLTRPHWSDNPASTSSKPWYQERPRPQQDRPSYPAIDKYEENPSQAQKWPPERPSWDRYGDSQRPSSDIITDDGPPNFPSTWDRPGQRPSYTHHTESYVNEHGSGGGSGGGGWHDRNDFPGSSGNNKYPGRPGAEEPYYDRPHFSHYQYPTGNEHPSNHPSSGDGQWVLLSTNRGYSKSRQRSIKLDAILNAEATGESVSGIKRKKQAVNGQDQEHVPAVTSKRQVRLTVLPSINGTNTTTSHGGLLEVERTFKTVDQSQKEYEQEKKNNNSNATGNDTKLPSNRAPAILLNGRPIRNNIAGGVPSSSAVLAAVGAGMLPATMAMMIPMMLGKRRRKRSVLKEEETSGVTYFRVPRRLFLDEIRTKKIQG